MMSALIPLVGLNHESMRLTRGSQCFRTIAMRALSKLGSLHSNLNYQVLLSQIRHLSKASKSSKLPRPEKTQEHLEKQTDNASFGALFNEITNILGADNLIPGEPSSGLPIFGETSNKEVIFKEQSSCTQNVCRNAEDNLLQEKKGIL